MSTNRTSDLNANDTVTLETVSNDELACASGGRTDAPSSQVHTVQRGDNLTNIAKGSGHSLGTILKWNPQYQNNPDLIHPGEYVTTSTPRYN